MPGSGLPARDAGPSELGVRAGTTPRERHSLPGTAAGDQLADERCLSWCDARLRMARPAAKITISFGSPFGSPISLAPLTFSNGLPEGAEIEAMLAAHRKWVGRPASLP
jgi:hypothetical protein